MHGRPAHTGRSSKTAGVESHSVFYACFAEKTLLLCNDNVRLIFLDAAQNFMKGLGIDDVLDSRLAICVGKNCQMPVLI